MKVYIVTTGSYSDYQVESVWSTAKKAKARVKVLAHGTNAGYFSDEVDQADEIIPTVLVNMDKEGNVTGTISGYDNPKNAGFIGFTQYSSKWNLHRKEWPVLLWKVATEDKERAIKVVNEKRAQIIANNLWGDNEAVKAWFGGDSVE